MDNAENVKQQPIKKLDKNSSIAKEIGNILQGKGTQYTKNDPDTNKSFSPQNPKKIKKNGTIAENLSNMLQKRNPQGGANVTRPKNKNELQDGLQESQLSKPNKLEPNKALANNLSNIFQKRKVEDKTCTAYAQPKNENELQDGLQESQLSKPNKLEPNKALANNLSNIFQKRKVEDKT